MTIRKFIAAFLLLCIAVCGTGQITRIEPPNWWTGMQEPRIQLMIYGKEISELKPVIDHDGILIERVITTENPNYLFADLLIDPDATTGGVSIEFHKSGVLQETHQWQLLDRAPASALRKGFDASDVIYLITPDRFANGDLSNDAIQGMRELPDRSNKGGRHGGDLEGIRRHLNYIADMGFTAIWLNPVLENDMDRYSYHGYSTTDFYRVDPRFGSNAELRQLTEEAASKGIGLIMDMITNHCGSRHWWMDDLPSPDWINTWNGFTRTNHRKSALHDPYVAQSDLTLFTDGWFDRTMPDLNQRNPQMATYLIQNAIWWVEYLGLSGIRMDTYPYSDKNFMADWTRRLMAEYPALNIVGEHWFISPPVIAYWQRGKVNDDGYVSYLPSLMDFPLHSAMIQSLTSAGGWDDDWVRLYEMLAHDYLYADPYNFVVFADNHDMSRIFSRVDEDFQLFKLAMTYVLTTRGIPQIFYGTEILMTNPGTDDHGIIRSDFPGGWPGDAVNGFTGEGLMPQQREAQSWLRHFLHWRKEAEAIHTGRLMHFEPRDGVYVYFRYNAGQKIMVILNKKKTNVPLEPGRFSEIMGGVVRGKEIFTGEQWKFDGTIEVLPGPWVIELE